MTKRPGRKRLTLRELEAFSGARLTVFFAFLHTGIAGHAAVGLQGCPQRRVGQLQCTGDGLAKRARLTHGAAANQAGRQIKLGECIGELHGLLDEFDYGFVAEIGRRVFLVNDPFAGSGGETHPGDRCFPAA